MRKLAARMVSAFTAPLLGALLWAPPLAADDVYLKNGRSFENVVAEVGDAQVRIHMPGGVISLPRSAVERVTKADSSFAEYSRRKQQLESRDRGAGTASAAQRAEDWLELARWARSNGLPQGAREAALAAAEINPRQPGLAGVLRGFGYVYEESLDRWVSYDDSMRMHGFVQDGGAWVSREEQAERVRSRAEARAQSAQAARDEAAAVREMMAAEMMQAQIAAAQQGGYDSGSGGQFLGGYYGGFGGGLWPFGASSVFGVPGFGIRARAFGERHHPGERHGEHGAARVPHSGGARFNSPTFGVQGSPRSSRPSQFVH